MRILYVITQSERGGAQQHVRDLAIGMREQGNAVAVAIGTEGWLQDELNDRGIQTERIRLRRTWNPIIFLEYLIDLYVLIKKSKPDFVHFHSSHTLIGTWAVRMCFPSVKSVITLHGLSILYPSATSWVKQWVYVCFLKTVLTCADVVVCVCLFDQRELIRLNLVRRDKSVVIYNGIIPPSFLPQSEARNKLGLGKDQIVIGTLGRFVFQKNAELLVRAFSNVKDKTSQLCLIGHGPQKRALKVLVQQLDLGDRVFFHEGDATLLKAFSFFVLPSRFEGFPYVLLEAALAEVPIVATRVGGVTELIEDNVTGYLVTSNDVDHLTRSVEDALAHPENTLRRVLAAKKRVQDSFSLSRMVKNIEAVYVSLE